MEKTIYEIPKLEVIEIVDADIVTTSDFTSNNYASGTDCLVNH